MTYVFLIAVVLAVFAALAIAAFTNFELDDMHYDRVKWIVIRGHYIVVFVGMLVETFKFPYGAETVTLVAGIFALLAGLLGISKSNYYATRNTSEMTEEEAYDALNEFQNLYDEIDELEKAEGEDEDE